MNPKEFIEKAVEGGWEGFPDGLVYSSEVGNNVDTAVLDPLAWEAVGKVEGWEEDYIIVYGKKFTGFECRMHLMIHHLISGGSITSYLETL